MRVFTIKNHLTLLVTYLKPVKLQLAFLFVALVTSLSMELINPQIVGQFIDTATRNGTSNALLAMGCVFLLVVIVDQLASIISSYLSAKVAWKATNHLRHDLIKHCLTLDLSYHKEHPSGEMIERVDGDVSQLSNFFSQFTINLFSHTILLLVILILFFTISWLVGLVMTVFVIIAACILNLLRKQAIPAWVTMRQTSAFLFGEVGELLGSTEIMSANGATAYSLNRFDKAGQRWYRALLKANTLGLQQSMGSRFFFVFGTAIVLALGTYLWSSQSISLGTVYKLFAYTNLLTLPVMQLQAQMQDLQKAEASLKRIYQLLDTSSKISDGSKPLGATGPLAVDFEHVTFGYQSNELALRDVSFQLAPGKILGLLGRTGSGKTTIARLLFRLYDIQQGQICLGGIPIQQAKLADLRERIGIVTQDVQLFHASVRDNLTFFEKSIPDAQILETLSELGLLFWYQALPQGLDTVLGGKDAGLSAGEAQLLAFARVFLRDPGLVILDEASSRLDPATERLIERAVSKLLTNRTAIIIAHRLSTIQRADEIAILENGALLEYGQRLDLINDLTSRFSSLLKQDLAEDLV